MALRLYGSTASQRGQLLIIATIFLAVLFIIAFSLSFTVTHTSSTVKKTNYEKKSLNAAEAGIQKAISTLNDSSSYTGETNTSFGDGQFTTSVTSINSTTKQIDATAYIPNAANPIITKHLRANATIDATFVSFTYGVQIGEGGLTLKQNSSITGSVYSNGSIIGENGSFITGDAYVAAGVDSSPDQTHDACATGSSSTCQNYDIGYTVSSQKRDDAAQRFKPNTSKNLVKTSLRLKKTGTPSDAAIMVIEDDDGVPSDSGGDIVATGTLQGSLVGSSYGWIDITFTTNPSLVDSKYYWLVFDGGSYNSSNHYIWSYDNNTEGNYLAANANGKYSENYSNKPWNNVNSNSTGDLEFKIWLGSGTTVINGTTVKGDAHAHSITNTSKICGNAYYYDASTIDSNSLNFLNSPENPCSSPYTNGTGYQPTADPTPQAMPISDANITDWETSAVAGGTKTCTSGSYVPTDGEALGPVKIPCDLNIENGQTITVNGPIWVAGNINLYQNAIIKLAPAFGGLSTTIIADDPANPTTKGIIDVNNGVKVCGSAGYDSVNNVCNPSNGSYIMIISAHHNATTNGIKLKNHSDGAIFYTSLSKIKVEQTASAKQITGWGVELENNSNIIYEVGLASSAFTTGPGASWTVAEESWSEIP